MKGSLERKITIIVLFRSVRKAWLDPRVQGQTLRPGGRPRRQGGRPRRLGGLQHQPGDPHSVNNVFV